MMTCHECQNSLLAYIHGELSPHRRRRVAYHLDDCMACYQVYLQQRQMTDELRYTLPLLGQGDPPRFERVWASIQADMREPRPGPGLTQARYGLAVLLLALACLFPWVLNGQPVVLAAPPTQPSPQMLTVAHTPPHDGSTGTATVMSLTEGGQTVTPEALPRLAPAVPEATAAP